MTKVSSTSNDNAIAIEQRSNEKTSTASAKIAPQMLRVICNENFPAVKRLLGGRSLDGLNDG